MKRLYKFWITEIGVWCWKHHRFEKIVIFKGTSFPKTQTSAARGDK